MEMAEGEGTTEENYDVDIATTASSLGGSGVFHIINDIVGFVLYMHQQIPSYVISSYLRISMLRCILRSGDDVSICLFFNLSVNFSD
ncbi:hypothetical protein AXX17_AT1G02430 [Arabidopsis thaliana]|jgi:hypothetical protein|uniref:Uncharacterized protein n=1 Tax=Arabidopsis thaliana TaxID=3702 RepID=A0A178W5X4_ARATH|nr:hypothetical protein AXX17_AT1G02430 [Arabidopsis thaliana]